MIKEYYNEFPEKKKVVHRDNLKSEIANLDGLAKVVVTGRYVYPHDETNLQKDDSASNDVTIIPYEKCSCEDGWYEVECGMRNVTDGIGDHFKINTIRDFDIPISKMPGNKIEETKDNLNVNGTVDRWEPSQPVLISAQTGRGKNFFIENTLLPYVRELNMKKETRQKILILSNRIALTLQMKDRLKQGLLYQGDDEDRERSYSEYKSNILGAEYADVLSYQGFLNRLEGLRHAQGRYRNKKGKTKQMEQPKYLFIICDEAHFFTSDSMFNPDTDKILQGITDVFRNAIRVYMTATPYECMEHIQRHEKETVKPNYPEYGVLYDFKRDYKYLTPKPYSNIEELYDIIENSGSENWLIFIDDVKKGMALKEELESEIESLRGRVYAVSAGSKNDESYQRMVKDETINVALKSKRPKRNDESDAHGTGDKEKKVEFLLPHL